jgi:SIR2-like domain
MLDAHDPAHFAAELGAKLATRSRHVCALLGAGAARACGLPDVAKLEKLVAKELKGASSTHFKELVDGRNLEEGLSRLRRIAALVDGDQQVDGLTEDGARALDKQICAAVVKHLALEKADPHPMRRFAAWANRVQYHDPLEIFTVNYDLLIETALEEIGALWFDGFVGSLRAPFRVDLVESLGRDSRMPPSFVRLWKLHGSLNWTWRESPAAIVRLGVPVTEGETAAIYPADTKYEESRRVPFVILIDRFRRALYQPESLLIVSGYAFGDAHLDELIFDAALRCPRSEFIAFCHADIPETLSAKAEVTPSLSVVGKHEAILGAERAPWKEPSEAPPGIWEDGEFKLGDFTFLAAFLARASGQVENDEEDE